MPVRMMGGKLRATPEPRGRTPGGALVPSPQPRRERPSAGQEASAVRGYRVEAICLAADDEARRAGRPCMTSRERRNARRRRDDWVSKLVVTPEGRELVRSEAEIIAGARAAAKAMAKAVPEYREVLGSALDLYVSSVAEYGLESPTARSFALQAAILSTSATALLGEAFEGGTRTMSGSRSAKDDKGVSGTIQVAGFRDLAHLAAAFVTKSQVAIETAWRCEDRARLEGKERDRQRNATNARMAIAQRHALEAELVTEDSDEGGVSSPDSHPASEEHGPSSGEEDPFASKTSPDDGDDLDTHDEPNASHNATSREDGASPSPDDEPVFCNVRKRLVPARYANKPEPSGPGYPERRAAERLEIDAWEARMRARALASNTKKR